MAFFRTAALGALLTLLPAAAHAQAAAATAAPTPSATISISETDAGMIFSRNHGSGVLNFGGKVYAFSLHGLTGGPGAGRASVKATGEVYNLTDIAKFPGAYTKFDADATFITGKGQVLMKNANGVVLRLDSNNTGLRIDIAAGGAVIKLKQ